MLAPQVNAVQAPVDKTSKEPPYRLQLHNSEYSHPGNRLKAGGAPQAICPTDVLASLAERRRLAWVQAVLGGSDHTLDFPFSGVVTWTAGAHTGLVNAFAVQAVCGSQETEICCACHALEESTLA